MTKKKSYILTILQKYLDHILPYFFPSPTTASIWVLDTTLRVQGNTGYSIYSDCDTTVIKHQKVGNTMGFHDVVLERGRIRRLQTYARGR